MHSTFSNVTKQKRFVYMLLFFFLHCYAMNLCANVINSGSNCDDVHILSTYGIWISKKIVSYHIICIFSLVPSLLPEFGEIYIAKAKKCSIPCGKYVIQTNRRWYPITCGWNIIYWHFVLPNVHFPLTELLHFVLLHVLQILSDFSHNK